MINNNHRVEFVLSSLCIAKTKASEVGGKVTLMESYWHQRLF
jgi:hypothetical protein